MATAFGISEGGPSTATTASEPIPGIPLELTKAANWLGRDWDVNIQDTSLSVSSPEIVQFELGQYPGRVNESSQNKVKTAREQTTFGLKWLDEGSPVLTSVASKLLQTLWAIVMSQALQAAFPLSASKISIFKDPELNQEKVVLRLYCKTTVGQALAFWDSLEAPVAEWLAMLSKSERRIFLRDLGLRIHWL